MAEQELTNKELVEKLQALGVEDINPNATKAQLKEMLAKEEADPINAPVSMAMGHLPDAAAEGLPVPEATDPGPQTDMGKIMEAIGGVVKSVDDIGKRVARIENGGKDDFMGEMKQADVDSAQQSKSKADPRVVAIVEETLGIDFGVEILPNPNSPGFNFTVLVPQRLSPIPGSSRPVIDPATGEYKKDERGGQVEENYWPGDRRSRAVGSTDSFDLIRDHCNKVRAHIVTYYEKMKKPLPEFKLRG